MNDRDRGESHPDVILATRVSPSERDHLARLARAADRTPSREVRRAIRFYLAQPDAADEFLRQQASEGE